MLVKKNSKSGLVNCGSLRTEMGKNWETSRKHRS